MSDPDSRPELKNNSTTEGLPIAPSMGPALETAHLRHGSTLVDRRVLLISAVSIVIALASGLIAQLLVQLIGLITNIAFYGRFSTVFVSPADHHLGYWVLVIPVLGGIVVGLMARYGSKAIRGHGIPEAMEQVLMNESRIPARLTFLKPISAAISIGTGGPFGAEGPIIATGGALGSVVGQLFQTTAAERKTLLAAGAAAGMTATFGSPVSAVLLAIELLVFEFRPRSFIPICLAAATAAGVRLALVGGKAIFPMPDIAEPSMSALVAYFLEGGLIGLASVIVTKLVYAVEDGFEKLPIHWMWWPALGGIAVGLVGLVSPHTMGVGYDNIEHIVAGDLPLKAMALLCGWKFLSWTISLGSGTSGGTLAPLFTIGGGLGALIGVGLQLIAPAAGIDVRVAALVGMAAIFAGASRALLASVVFAFETTRQPLGLLPLLAGCTTAYVLSCLRMKHTIMTEKIARRGVLVPSEYAADFLESIAVREVATKQLVCLASDDKLSAVQALLTSGKPDYHHQGYPVVENGCLLGVLTRRDLLGAPGDPSRPVRELLTRPPVVVLPSQSLREAADKMVQNDVGRLVMVDDRDSRKVLGVLTRGDILGAHRRRLRETHQTERNIKLFGRAQEARSAK